jgi:ankyrin repeat protein
MQLFQEDTFINWIRLCDPDKLWKGTDMERNITSITSPLYYALLEGLFKIVSKLLEKGADVNAQGGPLGNALQAALVRGHETLVALLLEKGARAENIATKEGCESDVVTST